MSDTSGRSWLTPLALYVPDESSSRTWQVMSLWGWTPFSGTLPRWGTTRRGELYELPTPALPTVEPASSSSLPTPKARDANEEGYEAGLRRMDRYSTSSLGTRVRSLLPTPVADHSRGLPQPGTDFQSLPNVVTSLLPTPQAHDAQGAKTPQQVATMRAKGHGVRNLNETAEHELAGPLLPTPKVQSNRVGRKALTQRHWSAPALEQALELAQGQLPRELTAWSELQGWSGGRMSPPFADGSTSSDDEPPDQLSLDEPESA